MEVCDIVQESVIKNIPKKKKHKKGKWLSEEALQIAKKRREAIGKEEKEIYPFLLKCRVHGTPLGLVHWKRASYPVEAGTSGFL